MARIQISNCITNAEAITILHLLIQTCWTFTTILTLSLNWFSWDWVNNNYCKYIHLTCVAEDFLTFAILMGFEKIALSYLAIQTCCWTFILMSPPAFLGYVHSPTTWGKFLSVVNIWLWWQLLQYIMHAYIVVAWEEFETQYCKPA